MVPTIPARGVLGALEVPALLHTPFDSLTIQGSRIDKNCSKMFTFEHNGQNGGLFATLWLRAVQSDHGLSHACYHSWNGTFASVGTTLRSPHPFAGDRRDCDLLP